MKDSILRQNLVELLRGGHAHVRLEQALDGLDPALRNERPDEGLHSVWEELEHMRLAQEDILHQRVHIRRLPVVAPPLRDRRAQPLRQVWVPVRPFEDTR